MKPKYLNVINNEAYIRNFNLKELVNEYSSPLFVLDKKELMDNIQLFKDEFKINDLNSHIVYASKALLLPRLCQIMNDEGLYIDAVSLGDLFVIKNSGFPMDKVVFHGNNKSLEELKFAASNDCIIVCDNYNELVKLSTLNKKVRTMFRVNPGIEAHTHKYIQTAIINSKFGESIFDDEAINRIMEFYLNHSNIKLLGFHSHIGSQIGDIEPFLLNVDTMLEFTKKIIDKYHYPLTSVNFGGGFMVPYTKKDPKVDLKEVLSKMSERIFIKSKELNIKLNDVYIEPGRSLIGNSTITLYSCDMIKTNISGHKFLFINGGMTDNIRPALYHASYEADIVNKMNDKKVIKCDVAGKCCESGDVIIKNIKLPMVDSGDILMVYDTGAYTYSMSSNYNNQLKPAFVFLEDKAVLVARHQELEDLITLFN